MDRYTLDYRAVTPANGRAGRSGVDAAARVHLHEISDVDGLQASVDELTERIVALERSPRMTHLATGSHWCIATRTNVDGIREPYLSPAGGCRISNPDESHRQYELAMRSNPDGVLEWDPIPTEDYGELDSPIVRDSGVNYQLAMRNNQEGKPELYVDTL